MEMIGYYLGASCVTMLMLSVAFFSNKGMKVKDLNIERIILLSIFWPVLVIVMLIAAFEKE